MANARLRENHETNRVKKNGVEQVALYAKPDKITNDPEKKGKRKVKQDDWTSWIFPRIRDEKMYRSVEQGPPFFRTFARIRVSSVTFDNFPSRIVRPRLLRVEYEKKFSALDLFNLANNSSWYEKKTIFISLSKVFCVDG